MVSGLFSYTPQYLEDALKAMVSYNLPPLAILYLRDARIRRLGGDDDLKLLIAAGNDIFGSAFVPVVYEIFGKGTAGTLTHAQQILSAKLSINLLLATTGQEDFNIDDWRVMISLVHDNEGMKTLTEMLFEIYDPFLSMIESTLGVPIVMGSRKLCLEANEPERLTKSQKRRLRRQKLAQGTQEKLEKYVQALPLCLQAAKGNSPTPSRDVDGICEGETDSRLSYLEGASLELLGSRPPVRILSHQYSKSSPRSGSPLESENEVASSPDNLCTPPFNRFIGARPFTSGSDSNEIVNFPTLHPTNSGLSLPLDKTDTDLSSNANAGRYDRRDSCHETATRTVFQRDVAPSTTMSHRARYRSSVPAQSRSRSTSLISRIVPDTSAPKHHDQAAERSSLLRRLDTPSSVVDVSPPSGPRCLQRSYWTQTTGGRRYFGYGNQARSSRDGFSPFR